MTAVEMPGSNVWSVNPENRNTSFLTLRHTVFKRILAACFEFVASLPRNKLYIERFCSLRNYGAVPVGKWNKEILVSNKFITPKFSPQMDYEAVVSSISPSLERMANA